jgi:hypothetical protein
LLISFSPCSLLIFHTGSFSALPVPLRNFSSHPLSFRLSIEILHSPLTISALLIYSFFSPTSSFSLSPMVQSTLCSFCLPALYVVIVLYIAVHRLLHLLLLCIFIFIII